jgi:hypothetical protein
MMLNPGMARNLGLLGQKLALMSSCSSIPVLSFVPNKVIDKMPPILSYLHV